MWNEVKWEPKHGGKLVAPAGQEASRGGGERAGVWLEMRMRRAGRRGHISARARMCEVGSAAPLLYFNTNLTPLLYSSP
jgi:hypothetical protein